MQILIIPDIVFFGAKINVVLPLIILISMMSSAKDGFFYGILAGVFLDNFSSTQFLFTITMPLIAILCAVVKDLVFQDDEYVVFALIFVACILSKYMDLLILDHFYSKQLVNFWHITIVSSAIATVISPVYKKILGSVYKNEEY